MANKRKNAGGHHTGKDIKEMLMRQNGLCVYCAVRIIDTYRIDHIMPIKLGGSNAVANVQLLCNSCNCKKSAKHPDAYEQSIGYVRKK